MNEALRDWVTNVDDTFYCIGTAAGPHPYPAHGARFPVVIGEETREQMMEREGRLPDSLVACIGGGSNAIGLFHPFLDDASRRDFGVEAARPRARRSRRSMRLARRRPAGRAARQPHLSAAGRRRPDQEGHSISAGLDYPGIGPEHSWLNETGRVTYLSAPTGRRWTPSSCCTRLEGIIPALEPATRWRA
jgi:tryptophan synthase beta chain